MTIYLYARVSTTKQSIDRQIRNGLALYPNAVIITEKYTGTKIDDRRELQKLLMRVKAGDKIVCDSVSRLSREADAGFDLYKRLYEMGVELEFIKEPHINTSTYKKSIEKQFSKVSTGEAITDNLINGIMENVKTYMMELAEVQVKYAFAVAQKETDDLHIRTKEGLETARLNGKTLGGVKGKSLNVTKKEPAKETIRKHSKVFGGMLDDTECMKLANVSRPTYYKYKKEILAEIEAENK